MGNKVAIVTGAARGQGAAHAKRLAAAGISVLLADVLDEPGQALAQELSAQGQHAAYVHLDVTSAKEWQQAVATAEQSFGTAVSVLVNNAGISARGSVEEFDVEAWDRVVAVNQTGLVLGMNAVIPSMRRTGGGSIINISSLWAHTGGVGEGSIGYVASKAAGLGITRNAALDLGPHGIRVNSVSPGYLDHVMTQDDSLDEVVRTIPLRRLAAVDDVAGVVAFLASDDAAYITGIDILVDGGLHLG